MGHYIVTVSKGTVTYDIDADSEEQALDLADEWYNEREFETKDIVTDKEKRTNEFGR